MKSKKKELGQFFTNPIIAEFMIKLAVTSKSKDLLDPAAGMGVFTKAAFLYNPNISITACEIDSEMAHKFRENNEYPYELLENDYLTIDLKKKFDAIICNPPYNKFQEISNRESCIREFKENYNISLSGYSNLCVYFLVKSMNELKKGGVCCYIIPSEFMNTGYGVVIKEYLLKTKMLKTVFKFKSTLNLFDEATTTSCILVLENKNHEKVEFVNVSSVDELKRCSFESKGIYEYSELSPKEKWLNYFDFSDCESSYNNTVKISTFGKVSRGIATGANSYFAINKSFIEKHRLSNDVCLPCVTKAPDIKELVFTNKSFKELERKDKKVYLFNGVKAVTKYDYSYIKYGETTGVNKAYLTSHRIPWYAIEEKRVAPIWICVFNRGKMKVIRNEAGVKNLTTFHGLYLNDSKDDFSNIMFCYLLTPLAQELIYTSRREYGDGLTKFEPNDLTTADMLDLRLLTNDDKRKILSIYLRIREKNDEIAIKQLDSIFRKYTVLTQANK